MALEKMTITAYSDSKFKSKVSNVPLNPMQVYINPEKYTHSYNIEYKNRQAQGSNGPSPIFNKYMSDTVTLIIHRSRRACQAGLKHGKRGRSFP